jgi:hypothetical protein
MTLRAIVAAELRGLAESYAPDELAFLALTSKVEFVVRDRLAFRLYRRLGADGAMVAREWRRTDLALLRNGAPELLLEVKAMYSFDAVGHAAGLRHFRSAIAGDCDKALRHAVSGAEVYALLLVTHPQANCGPELDGVIKYRRAIERAARAGIPVVRENARRAIATAFADQPLADHDALAAGVAFGIPVSIDYWLFGPYRPAPDNE